MPKFKIGDKVVRKKEHIYSLGWEFRENPVIISEYTTYKHFTVKGNSYSWDEDYFDLYEEPMKETKRHPHADIIHAWAEGEKIQYNQDGEWIYISNPSWSSNIEYRVKPKTITKKYRMANTSSGVVAVDVTNVSLDDPAEYHEAGFKHWVGNVVEVTEEVQC